MALLCTHSIGNPPQNPMVEFKMRNSVPSARYSPICNVLRQWKTSLIPIYRVYDSMIIDSIAHGTGLETYHVLLYCAVHHAYPMRVSKNAWNSHHFGSGRDAIKQIV